MGAYDGCNEVEIEVTDPNVVLSLRLTFQTSTNRICSLFNTFGIQSAINGPGAVSRNIILDPNQVSTVVPVGAAELSLSQITVHFLDGFGNTGSFTTTLSATTSTTITAGGGLLTFTPFNANNNQVNPSTSNTCTGILGDPLFSGFKGQQFFISGQDGQVLNLLSTFNMQLNGRLAQMEQGTAMVPDSQEEVRLRSEITHMENPAVPAFPRTVAWSHPGTYFSEAGVALLDEHRVYVKAGSFQTGWAKATLDGRPLAVGDKLISLGQGVNTTFIARVSAHEVMIRTVNVEYTLTNSDNFLNVDRVHLEKGVKEHSNFGGILGNTVDAKWQWQPTTEKEETVESGNLFERRVVAM